MTLLKQDMIDKLLSECVKLDKFGFIDKNPLSEYNINLYKESAEKLGWNDDQINELVDNIKNSKKNLFEAEDVTSASNFEVGIVVNQNLKLIQNKKISSVKKMRYLPEDKIMNLYRERIIIPYREELSHGPYFRNMISDYFISNPNEKIEIQKSEVLSEKILLNLENNLKQKNPEINLNFKIKGRNFETFRAEILDDLKKKVFQFFTKTDLQKAAIIGDVNNSSLEKAKTEVAKSEQLTISGFKVNDEFVWTGRDTYSLSKDWIAWGGSDGTPKTDLLSGKYRFSLKENRGSQLMSAAPGEARATFYSAVSRSKLKIKSQIQSILDELDVNSENLNRDLISKFSRGKKDNISGLGADSILDTFFSEYVRQRVLELSINIKIKKTEKQIIEIAKLIAAYEVQIVREKMPSKNQIEARNLINDTRSDNEIKCLVAGSKSVYEQLYKNDKFINVSKTDYLTKINYTIDKFLKSEKIKVSSRGEDLTTENVKKYIQDQFLIVLKASMAQVEFTKKMNTVFSLKENKLLRQAFVHEAMTGEYKFGKDSIATANTIMKFDSTISNKDILISTINGVDDPYVKEISDKVIINASFKTAGDFISTSIRGIMKESFDSEYNNLITEGLLDNINGWFVQKTLDFNNLLEKGKIQLSDFLNKIFDLFNKLLDFIKNWLLSMFDTNIKQFMEVTGFSEPEFDGLTTNVVF